MEEETKQFLIAKFVEQWEKDNPDLVEDISELSGQIVFFNLKWGTDFFLAHRKLTKEDLTPPNPTGR